jgi:prevent-host-death family protein
MVMLRINVHEAKARLSHYLDKVEKGETILLCRRNLPIAELRPLPRPGRGKRPIGLAKGTFKLGRAFFEPLPPEIEDAFAGKSS